MGNSGAVAVVLFVGTVIPVDRSNLIWAILMVLILGYVFLEVGGILLNRYYLNPRLWVGGFLRYRRSVPNHEPEENFTRGLKLRRAKKMEVVISFNPRNTGADFYIENPSYSHDLIIKNRWSDRGFPLMRGWKALLRRSVSVETTIECTPPGVLLFEGVPYTRRVLNHSDEFETGGYIFQYHNLSSIRQKPLPPKDSGVDVLEGRL